ncbi:MAG: SpoIID/LytB domain-containing protein [Actinomycetota bacterium]|nr:SpoIID/LytB domain-containing protein [Actinomycetota bacterium]
MAEKGDEPVRGRLADGRLRRGRVLTAAACVIALLVALSPGGPAGTEEEAAAGGGKITFVGHGRGHGVGMCMAGVYFRALRGEEYHQIIRAYYTGVDFSRVSDDMPIRVLCRDNVVRTYPLREYLYRLQEEPDTWPAQGLRVLAVAARTYVLSVIARGKHAKDGYDICPYGSCCQAFNEQIDPAKRPNTVAAVNATAGEIITYGGQPIIAAYSSCCGGYTAGTDEAWGGNPVPYLSPVPDDACAADEDHDWQVTMTWEELQAKLNANADTAVGTLYGLEVISRWTSGRVKQIRIDGSAGSRTVSGTLFASVVGLQTHFFSIASQNFDEYLLLQNPGDVPAVCTITYMFPGGGATEETCEVAPHSRHTICVNDRVQNAEVSIAVDSEQPVVAERAMYFDFLGNGIKGGHACMGLPEARDAWCFAEGYTGGEFDTFFLVQNPNQAQAHLEVSFLGNGGEVDRLYYTLPPSSRMTIWMDMEPGMEDGEFSAHFQSDLPVVAERAMYFRYRGHAGGSAAEGTPSPERAWYFAEGYTGDEFDTYILLANPEEEAAEAKLTFMLPDATTRELSLEVAARSRVTVHVDDLPGLGNAEFSTRVEADRPMVAERAMYFSYFGRRGGHTAMGVREPAEAWYFAEGYTGGAFDTYLLLQNPGDSPAKVVLTYMKGDGNTFEQEVLISGRSRYTVHVDDLPGLGNAEFSTRVEADRPLVAERAMYFDYRNRDGGSCSQGTNAPSRRWYFAEGYTGS